MSGIKFTTGTVSAVDEKTVRVRVRLPELDNLRTAWLEVLQRNTQNNKDYWLPDIGEQVKLLLDPYGDDGVVLGAVYSQVDRPAIASRDKRRVDFADGTFVEYDRKTHTMAVGGTLQTLTLITQANVLIQTQNATVKASQQLILDAPDTLTTGNLTVQKQLTYLGGMSGSGGKGVAATINGDIKASGDIRAGNVSLENHQHSNGHEGRPTGKPI
ncbi:MULTISPECIES: phage baseplate assembly protein V [unclassified Arsenophonus]|uniref:phage baseplate assembly protein V n=1 Tax=unclassified Arsenophonus TaxID=2627083 RepID=UPI00285FF781|nr:phage baseplate assembly protein V [Arsenophonus sp.]MDR5611184.1 phage baseplate assembly protein V [Arsenophonus sp.]MDR5614813.1 phage baseplate assembly protein V [Arsenophonus sp.]